MKEGLFYPANTEFDKKVTALKNSFRSRMNGETSQQMTARGIKYRKNYGISIPHIKEIAKAYSFTPQECERLWMMEIRETMLLAAILMPEDELTPERMQRWSARIVNSDIAEQSAFFLFSRMNHADGFLTDCLSHENRLLISTAFLTAGRRFQLGLSVSDKLTKALLQLLEQMEHLANRDLMRGISLFLRQGLRHNNISSVEIRHLMNRLLATESLSGQQLYEELNTELLYLEP